MAALACWISMRISGDWTGSAGANLTGMKSGLAGADCIGFLIAPNWSSLLCDDSTTQRLSMLAFTLLARAMAAMEMPGV